MNKSAATKPGYPKPDHAEPSQTEPSYDVIIVGGGIQGAGVAQAVQAAGYNAMILEKSHWAAGTSSKSSKLIHGGLRYLQTGNFSLVRESLWERRLLLKNAPGLVHLNGFYLPVYRHSRHRPWQIRLALMAYWLLSGCCPDGRFQIIKKKHWPQLKGLKTENLIKVFRYQDAQTDDTKLTEAVVRSAAAMGTVISWPSTLLNAQQIKSGYRIEYEETGADHNKTRAAATCRFLVNAGGPC